jgi:hypothetical protein
MICPQCSYSNKGSGKCWACGYPMSPEVPKEVYRIPKRSKKRKLVVDEDISFFEEIWTTRPHKSEVSGAPLGDEFNVCFFSHILSKGAYPRFRHNPKNILLMTFEEHQEFEFTDRKDPKWNDVRDLAEELIIEYYNQPIV